MLSARDPARSDNIWHGRIYPSDGRAPFNAYFQSIAAVTYAPLRAVPQSSRCGTRDKALDRTLGPWVPGRYDNTFTVQPSMQRVKAVMVGPVKYYETAQSCGRRMPERVRFSVSNELLCRCSVQLYG